MRHRLVLCAAVLTSAGAGPALAACSVSSDVGAVAKTIDATVQADADIVVSMSLLPKLMHIDYASAARIRPSCALGTFTVGTASYELYGDDTGNRRRMGKPARAGDPIAQILPVTNIIKAIEASKLGKSAVMEGYLLATVAKTGFTGWRYYTGVPDPATLKRDMAEALAGSVKPIFRQGADGKTAIFLPAQ